MENLNTTPTNDENEWAGAIAEIEAKHIHWLKNQPSKYSFRKYSELNEYYEIYTISEHPIKRKIEFSDKLPLNIKEDCLNQWKKVGLI